MRSAFARTDGWENEGQAESSVAKERTGLRLPGFKGRAALPQTFRGTLGDLKTPASFSIIPSGLPLTEMTHNREKEFFNNVTQGKGERRRTDH